MATQAIQTHGEFASTSFADRIVSAFQAFRAERTRRSRLARELALLSDRDMADLGFSRSDVPSIINGTYKR